MITIECFPGLPIEYESFLIEKYESYFTTCRYIEIYYPTHAIDYMLVYKNGELNDLLVFGSVGNTSICFNSFAKLEKDIILECTNELFKARPLIQKINVKALIMQYAFKKAILYNETNEYIINLPSAVDDYFLQLGHSTRKSVRNHKSKLLRDYPGVKFSTKFGDEIEESDIDKIIQMNIARMRHKGIMPAKDENEAKRIFRYSKHYGVLTYIEIDGVIVAGDIAYILNKRLFTEVIAHDNNFSAYNLGEVCMFQMIQTAIEKGFLTLYMSWGDNEYKKRLLAKPYMLYSYSIYRTYSFDYIKTRINSVVMTNFTRFRLSKYSKPIRETIKTYRRKKWLLNGSEIK